MKDMESMVNYLKEIVMKYGLDVISAIVTIIVGLWIIRMIGKMIGKGLDKSKMEVSLKGFLVKLVTTLLKVLLFLSVASTLGVETTSFAAILAGAGLAIGMALQGSLSNFAGGVLILVFKPFKVGDFIDAQGHAGVVKAIDLFTTVLNTPDNKTIIIPNGGLSNGSIVNFSAEENRRVDFVFGIGYDDDLRKAKEVIASLVAKDERIFKDPAPQIVISELADSSVNITTRVWGKSADYWGIFFDLMENVKLEFDAQGISIPYPQQDVHVNMLDKK